MHVIPLTAEHITAYRRLMLHAYQHAADAFTSTAEERSTQPDAWWLKRMADPNGEGVAFGAFREGELVGTVALEFSAKTKTKHKVQVVGMFVSAACRGHGIGKALIQAAIEYARSRSCVRLMTLTVTQGNDAALGLYGVCGFKQFGIEPMAILTPTGYKAKIHLWRSLNEDAASLQRFLIQQN